MGLLDGLISALGPEKGGGAGQAELIRAVLGMLGNDAPGGGLGSLITKFQQGGLADVMNSWISTGANLPISGDQLGGVLGNDTLGQMANQLGMSQGDIAGQLSQILPQVIDQLTPQGRVPQGGLGNVADLIGSLLRR
jgi:uncharacterized protein YidB (DUF937 family)